MSSGAAHRHQNDICVIASARPSACCVARAWGAVTRGVRALKRKGTQTAGRHCLPVGEREKSPMINSSGSAQAPGPVYDPMLSCARDMWYDRRERLKGGGGLLLIAHKAGATTGQKTTPNEGEGGINTAGHGAGKHQIPGRRPRTQ